MIRSGVWNLGRFVGSASWTRGRPGISVIERENVGGNGSDISPTAKIEMGRVSGDNWRDSNGQKRAGVARGRNRGGHDTRKRVQSFSRNRHLDGMPALGRELFPLPGLAFVSSVSLFLFLSWYLVSLLVCMRTHYPRLSLNPGTMVEFWITFTDQ